MYACDVQKETDVAQQREIQSYQTKTTILEHTHNKSPHVEKGEKKKKKKKKKKK